MKNTKFKLIVSQITFENADALMDAVVRMDKIRLYQTNKPCVDPLKLDVLDSTSFGSGECLSLSYDMQDRTLDITGNGGVCAVMIKEEGFSAGELLLGMSEQFDFFSILKPYSFSRPELTATIQVFEDEKLIDERTTLLCDYQSKFFVD